MALRLLLNNMPGYAKSIQASIKPLHYFVVRGYAASAPHVSYEELKGILAKPPTDLTLIDVREPHEYNAGTIPSAKNVPCENPNCPPPFSF